MTAADVNVRKHLKKRICEKDYEWNAKICPCKCDKKCQTDKIFK